MSRICFKLGVNVQQVQDNEEIGHVFNVKAARWYTGVHSITIFSQLLCI